ncbi:hypothetical protein [Psychromonas sp.]
MPECTALSKSVDESAPENKAYQKKGQKIPNNAMLRPLFVSSDNSPY